MAKNRQLEYYLREVISDDKKEELIGKIEHFKISLRDIPGEPSDIIDQNPKNRTGFDSKINEYFTIQSEKSLDLQNDLDLLIEKIVMSKQSYQQREKEAEEILMLEVDDIKALSHQEKQELLEKIEGFLGDRIGSRVYPDDPNPRSRPYTHLLRSVDDLGKFVGYSLESKNNKEDESSW
jgi:hypothetical protein